jgi:hypothetical protein
MVKTCQICNKEFETTYSNKKYCSEECSREAIREADRLRKNRERQIKKKKLTAEEAERKRAKKADVDKRAEEAEKEKKADLQSRLALGDPKAKMEVAERFSFEYWEAYKEEFIQDYYNKNYNKYVNDISIYDDDFSNKVVVSIKEKGRIYSRLVRNKK